MANRIFQVSSFLKPSSGEPLRTVITQSQDAAVVAWCILPGQRLEPHVHPHGQDTWTVLAGSGAYTDGISGSTVAIKAGDVVIARRGEVHGVYNPGPDDLLMVAVVCPPDSGFELVSLKETPA